jgi:hypothetical protein
VEQVVSIEPNYESGYFPKPTAPDFYRRADGYEQEQVDLHCRCSFMDGYPDEECILHGRWPWRGDWIGAKVVVFNDWLPPGTIYTTDREVFCTRKDWETIYRSMKIKVDAARDVRRIIGRKMCDVITWLQEAGHDV